MSCVVFLTDGSSVDVSESGSENSVKEGPDSFQAQQDILNQEKRAVMHNKELLDEVHPV